MFDGRLPSFANTRSMRVAGGLGTVARVVGDAQEIYDQRISVDDALRRIESLYKPYHRALRRLFTRVHREFGAADADRLPFHAVVHGSQGRAAARRRGAGRPLRHELRRRGVGNDRDDVARAWLRGQPQQALCRRLHHRALRQPGRRPACHPARDQPRALHGRAPVRALPRASRAWRPTWRRWPSGSPPSRSRSCGPTAPRPNRPPRSALRNKRRSQEKGPSASRRPKSREETPKEGGGNEREPVTALHQYAPAPHKKQVPPDLFARMAVHKPAQGLASGLSGSPDCRNRQ